MWILKRLYHNLFEFQGCKRLYWIVNGKLIAGGNDNLLKEMINELKEMLEEMKISLR